MAGCAAGHRSRPSEAGAARAPEEAQDIAFASGGKTEPAAHASQTPEQVEFMRPALPPKVPAGQSEQEAAPAVAKVPGAQGAHTPAPLGTEPAGHNCAAVTETVLPAAHKAQTPEQRAEVAPALAPKVPAGHNVHEAAPAREKVPGGQGVQAVVPCGAHEPAAHGVQKWSVGSHAHELSTGDLTRVEPELGPALPAAQEKW